MHPFSQKVTSLFVQGQKKLLSNYLTLVQSSSGFIFHRDMIHDEDGFMLDGSGVSVRDLEDNGGSVTEYRDFRKVVKECSNEVSKTGDVSLEMARKRADGRKKRKPEGKTTEPEKKKSKTAILNDDEKFELEDSAGLEQKYTSSFIGLVNIPLKNLKIPSELKNMVNIYRVYRIMSSMKSKFDPSQTILVVSPEDDSKPPSLRDIGSQRFLVVQKIHTFSAFQQLEERIYQPAWYCTQLCQADHWHRHHCDHPPLLERVVGRESVDIDENDELKDEGGHGCRRNNEVIDEKDDGKKFVVNLKISEEVVVSYL